MMSNRTIVVKEDLSFEEKEVFKFEENDWGIIRVRDENSVKRVAIFPKSTTTKGISLQISEEGVTFYEIPSMKKIINIQKRWQDEKNLPQVIKRILN
jgi:hypothetical protein